MGESAFTILVNLDSRCNLANSGLLIHPQRLLLRFSVNCWARFWVTVGLQVPHRKTYVIGREALLAVVTRDELEIEPERDLPPMVLLIARPDPEAWCRP